jgi:hypothetical protein
MAENHQAYYQEGLDSISSVIRKNIRRFIDAEIFLGQKAQTQSRLVFLIKLSLILLGLLVTARDGINQLLSPSNPFFVAAYVLIGLLITGLATVETTFKLDERSAELRVLATTCRNARLGFENRLASIATNRADGDLLAEEQALSNDLLEQLIKIQNQAAALRINVSLDIVSPDSNRERKQK